MSSITIGITIATRQKSSGIWMLGRYSCYLSLLPLSHQPTTTVIEPRQHPTAVAIFGRLPAADARRRGLSTAAASLFAGPAIAEDVDIHYFTLGIAAPRIERGRWHHPQAGHTFAERFESMLERLADLGYQRVVIVGTDCPSLDAETIQHAVHALDQNGCVLGPDTKGGAYLIGLHLAERARLRGITWCGGSDLAQIRLRFSDLPLTLFDERGDIHSARDLQRLTRIPISHRLRIIAAIELSRLGDTTPANPTNQRPICLRHWIRAMLTYLIAPPGALSA